MKTILIVAPHFPPVDTADMHRVRMSIPHFEKYGWKSIVLTIDGRHVSARKDPRLLDSMAPEIVVKRVTAVPEYLTRVIGIGDAAIRAYPFLLLEGLRLIKLHHVDLVYISTTQFYAFTLGPIWKRRTGVPFVLDIQDPWANWYVPARGQIDGDFKRKIARRIHRHLESTTMPLADGLISVCQDYVDELQSRYPNLRQAPYAVLPFGVSPSDFEIDYQCVKGSYDFDPSDGNIHGVYVGRGGGDMARALGIMFSALKIGLTRSPHVFSRIRLHFVGTDYAPSSKSRESVRPIALKYGVDRFVTEVATRVPYFHGLGLLKKSNFLLVPGSEDPRYTASKILPYLYLSKPLFAVFNERSPVMSILERYRCAGAIGFGSQHSDEDCARELVDAWEHFLSHPDKGNTIEPSSLKPFFSSVMTEHQCRVFDEVQSKGHASRTGSEMAV
jgi:hypothetical protein